MVSVLLSAMLLIWKSWNTNNSLHKLYTTGIKYIVFNRWQPISINTFVRFDVVPDNQGFPRPPWTRWCVVGGPHWWHTPGSPWTRPYRTGPAVASQIWASCSHCKQQNNFSLSFKRSYLEYFCNVLFVNPKHDKDLTWMKEEVFLCLKTK